MKYIFSALLLTILSVGAFAQSTTPRFGNPPYTYGNNSGSFVSFYNLTTTDTAGSTCDSVQIRPQNPTVFVNLTVKDSCVLNCKSLKNCFKGDQLYIYVTNPAQSGIVRLGSQFIVATGTNGVSLTANKHFLIEFWFDGAYWVELGRTANY